jgi:hypothetical protein
MSLTLLLVGHISESLSRFDPLWAGQTGEGKTGKDRAKGVGFGGSRGGNYLGTTVRIQHLRTAYSAVPGGVDDLDDWEQSWGIQGAVQGPLKGLPRATEEPGFASQRRSIWTDGTRHYPGGLYPYFLCR